MMRVRLIQLVVKPVVVLDDGEELKYLQADPMTVNAADIDAFPGVLRAKLAEAQAQIDAQSIAPNGN
jgi:hypothetical protein